MKKMKRTELSIIIPLYNEEKRFPKSFRKVDRYFENIGIAREYILVDDGSRDNTLKKIRSLRSKAPIRVLENPRNLGKGAALKLGVLSSLGENIFFTDADLSTPITEFKKLCSFLGKYDVVIGSRRLKRSNVKIAQPLQRKVLGAIFYLLFSFFFNSKVKDTNCGFKCFKGKTGREVYKKLTNARWGFDAEFIFLAEKYGYRIKEVPVTWLNDPHSRVSSFGASISTVLELAKIRINEILGIYDKDDPEILTKNLYRGMGKVAIFSYIRFWDAPYKQLEKLIPRTGEIVDLGCGEGIFTNYVAMASVARKMVGVDKDKERVRYAYRGLPNTKFVNGDITKRTVPQADCVLLVHVLHHLNSYKEQEELLTKCAAKLKDGGKLLIAEIEPKPSFKYLVTWFTDHFLVPWLFEKRAYSPIFFRKKSDWKRLFNKLGFTCKIISAEVGKPFTHIILECYKT